MKKNQSKWDYGWLFMAEHYANTWSKDPSTKVGAVVVNDNQIPIAWGYNGHPRGVADTRERYENRELKYAYVAHAESNAIDNATASVRGATMYCTLFPCHEAKCAHRIIQAGIKRVVAPDFHTNDERGERWIKSHLFSFDLLREAGVEIVLLDPIDIQFWRQLFAEGKHNPYHGE